MRLSSFERISLALILWVHQTNAASIILRQAPPSNSSTPSNATSGAKAGLAWANGDKVDIQQFLSTDKVSWYYTWSIWPIARGRVDIEFVPMLWGPKSVTEFESKIEDTVRSASRSSSPVTAVLGMNEPEQPGQSNMTASEGVEFWKTHMEPLRESLGVRLGSPGVSSAPSAKTWLDDFFRECDGECNVDFIALHWYGTNADQFIAHLWDYYYAFNKTIWVTEWACHNFVDSREQCEEDEVVSFLNQTQFFMDQTPWVERYSWFGALTDLQGVNQANRLLEKGGQISELGRQYIGAGDFREPLEGGSAGANPVQISRASAYFAASIALSSVFLFL